MAIKSEAKLTTFEAISMIVGNFFIELVDHSGKILLPLVMLDSNMYGEGGWFYSGFDRIQDEQVDWCMSALRY